MKITVQRENVNHPASRLPQSLKIRAVVTRRLLSPVLREIAFFTALVFAFDQIIFAEGVMPFEQHQTHPAPSVADIPGAGGDQTSPQFATNTTIDFLSGTTLPLSPVQGTAQTSDSNKTYDQNGMLRSEVSQTGNTIWHVYEGESIQPVIDQSVAGDTIFVHAGTYLTHLILRQGVGLKGEDAKTTVIHGNYEIGVPVICALGDNRIEGLTVTGARDGLGNSVGAVTIEGDRVKVRGNLIALNLSAGVYVQADAENVLIEENIFSENSVAVKEPKDNNVVRYNTITGYETEPALVRITGIRYVHGQGFRLEIQDPQGAFSYRVEYSNDYGQTWIRSKVQDPPGFFKDECLLANDSGKTIWLDDGSKTSPGPLDVDVRWYRVVMTESFLSKIGVEILDGQAPLVMNNIIAHQAVQSIWEETATASTGTVVVENNILFHNEEKGNALGQHLPPAIGSKTGENWTGGNVLTDPQFRALANRDYSVPEDSPAFSLGAVLPEALKNALERASGFELKNTIQPLLQNGTVQGYQILYNEGSHEEFYNDGTIAFDQTIPDLKTSAEIFFTNQPDYELVYTVDGVEKREVRHLSAGANTLMIEAEDVFGNSAQKIVTVTLDQTPPVLGLQINDGDLETHTSTVVINLSGEDSSPLDCVRFSVDGGGHWTDWETFGPKKVLTVPDGEGVKEILCELRDAAGNMAAFSGTIRFVTTPVLPVVQILSAEATTSALYRLRYTVDGAEFQEDWYLQPGENRLMVCASLGAFSTFVEQTVTLDQLEPVLPAMPSIPAFPTDLVSLTTANGLILKYLNTDLVAIENPGSYTLLSPQLDASKNLIEGVLLFNNGDRLLFQNSKPVYLLKNDGEKTVYNPDGTVAYVLTALGKKTRFAYRLDAAQKVVSILSFEEEGGVSSLYDEKGRPVWIKKTNGTAIRYQDGFLSIYTDATGNIFHYETSILRQGNDLTGYRSELVSVTRAGTSTVVPIAAILADLNAYPSVKVTLEEELSLSIEYDPGGNMKAVISGKGETLHLENQLPVSFTNAAGNSFQIQNQVQQTGDLLSAFLGQSGVEQIFDDQGNLSGIRLSDGTLFQVSSQTLQQITLNDGSILSQLVWDGQDLTGFLRTYTNGTQEFYRNSRIFWRRDPQGNATQVVNDNYGVTTTEDGRTYFTTQYQNSQGLTEQLTELSSIQLPDGSWINFSGGEAVRHVQEKSAYLDATEVPRFLDGRFFVPLVQLSNASLRELTVDENGHIFSGQILFNDGTQYLIENDKIVKQITAGGQLMEVSGDAMLPLEPSQPIPVQPLTPDEIAYRDYLVERQMDFFVDGKGLHAGTGLPLDNLSAGGQQSNYSQTTLIGFWAEILAAIAKGDHFSSRLSRQEAFQKLDTLLETYQEVQRQAGWNGMVAFFTITPVQEPVLDEAGKSTGETRTIYKYNRLADQVGFGDVLNLSVSLATVIGALSGYDPGPESVTHRDSILFRANAILGSQEAGYEAFYEPSSKRFRGAFSRNAASGMWEPVGNYYIDRVFNEFRTGMIWLAAKYPQYQEALHGLQVAIRPYKVSGGETMDLAVPFDGGAFQMFWPLIHVDETQYPEFEAALRGFLYAQSEHAAAHGLPGLLSAGDYPGHGYEGKVGLPGAAETDDLLKTDVGSIYGTAAAFGLAPHYTLQFLKNIETKFPGIKTSAGFVDALRLQAGSGGLPEPVFSDKHYGVDQAAFILSLSKTSQDYFGDYLLQSGIWAEFDRIFRKMSFGLKPPVVSNQAPPDFGEDPKVLFAGTNAFPDGLCAGLIKQPAFVPVIFDPEYGEGSVFNYLTASGGFHHSEIEFGSGGGVRRMNLQEYFLSPKRAGAATALLGGVERDVMNSAVAQGAFYTPGKGFCRAGMITDPGLGAVRHLQFQFLSPFNPVGIWANYIDRDFQGYDFLSVPVKLASGTPERVRLKFQFYGLEEVFLTGTLTHEWQYISIPVPRSSGKMSQLAISIQPEDGKSVAGDLYLGPLSALKVRTSNEVDWKTLLGKTETEIRALIQQKIAEHATRGGWVRGQEILEDFELDSSGKLVRGVLRLVDGGIQYFQGGRLVKWIFSNGRTLLFEEGLATFVVDLVRGKLETGRFYYDRNIRGKIHSFVVQDNESKKVFGADGQLQTMSRDGAIVRFEGGTIASIETPQALLTGLEFSDDGILLKAYADLKDGGSLNIDHTGQEGMDVGGGVKLFYEGPYISAIETPQNGRTDFSYMVMPPSNKFYSYEARFYETVTDPMTGQSSPVRRSMSLAEYIQRPERVLEKQYLVREIPFDVISQAGSAEDFSLEPLLAGEWTRAQLVQDSGPDLSVNYQFCYQNVDGAVLGVSLKHPGSPVHVKNYDFLSLTLHQDNVMNWSQKFVITLKTSSQDPFYSAWIDGVSQNSKTFSFSLFSMTGTASEITLEPVRMIEGVGKPGGVHIADISYFSVQMAEQPPWEDCAGISASELQSLRIEAKQLASASREIVAGEPLVFTELAKWLDAPTLLRYAHASGEEPALVGFMRFDGTKFEIQGQNVNRITLPDGTVNEYAVSGNVSQGTIHDPASGTWNAGTLTYHYGALRRITQANGRQYDLSYEFDADGKEITVFKDLLSGEERRFKEGKLLSAGGAEEIETHYVYANGEIIGAELTYRNRVLNSTQYFFNGDGTQVTDERGTTWFYNANGNLIKHITRDGYLYEYSEYTHELSAGTTLVPDDYKNVLFNTAGLRAVRLKGYEAPDGSWIVWDGTQGSEVHLISGTQAVNLVFDEDQRILSGQIQFPDGLLLEIENYVPVRGRSASGQLFEYILPQATGHDIVQEENESYLGFRFKIGERAFTYNAAGELIRAESERGITDLFTYTRDGQGNLLTYTRLERKQIAFNGVPFPKEVELITGADQKIMDSGKEIAVHTGDGFLVGVYKEATDQWDVYSGSFASAGDRIGLKNFLSEIKTGDSVAAVVSDAAFSQVGSEILSLFEGLGAGGVRQAAASNSKWSFFGNENLSVGQGREQTGGGSFSTLTETSVPQNISPGTVPVFENVPMFFKISPAVSAAYSGFLIAYAPLKSARDMQSVTVYDPQDEIVFSKRLDGISSYYEHGKVRETFNGAGELLSVHEYTCLQAGCQLPEDRTLSKITLVKGRQDFEIEARRLTEQIEQTKFDALYRLAWQDDVARIQIRENVDLGVAQINSQISSLESQRFRTEKQCHRFLFWKTCKEYTYEVPGVQGAINDLEAQRAGLIRNGEEQLAQIPGAILAKKLEIEEATAARILELQEQKDSFLMDILLQEMEPVITDLYRRIMGRDASQQEFDALVNRFKAAGQIDIAVLSDELRNSEERASRESQKDMIVQGVRSFLENYLAATVPEKTQLISSLHLNDPEAVTLDAKDISKVLAWLESRDLHFGQSAFLSLKEMLASKGTDVSMETLGKETILIDILTGVIHKFTEGDLVISMFAMDRAAAIHAQDLTSVRYSYQDLLTLYKSVCPDLQSDCSLRAIAHIGEDHFVVVKRVADTEVTYEETGKGADGEDVTISKEQFLKAWIAKDNAGYLMVSESHAIQAQKLTDQEAMKVRGAFWFIFFFVVSAFLTVASMVVSVFSPTFGKILGYAALVAGIIGIVAGLGGFIVEGIKSVFSAITSQSIFTTIKQGLAWVGKTLWQSVESVGRFILKGFEFLKGGFPGGLGSFGVGITNMKGFLFDGARILADGTREFTFGQIVARQLVAAGLNMSVSKGLEGLGLDPILCQLAGAFVGGGFLGIGQSGASFIRSGLQQFVLQGVSELGLRLGLAPPITGALSLLASTSLSSFFSGNFSLKPFTEIVPQMASQLTFGGFELLGRSMGLDSRLTQLLGFPIAAITGNMVDAFLGNDPLDLNPSSIFGLIKDAIFSRETLGGILSVSAEFLISRLGLDESLLGSFSSRIIAGLFGDFVASPTRFSIVDSIIKSMDESIYHFLDSRMLPQIFGAILDHGFAEGIEQYAISLFTQETLQEFTGAGESLSQWIECGLPFADDIIYKGESAKLLKLYQNGKTINFIYVPRGTQLEVCAIYEEYSNGRRPRYISWDTDGTGRITQVIVEERMPDGTVRRDLLDPNGQIREITFRDWNGETYGRLSFNSSGGIEFTNYNLGISNYLTADGHFTFNFEVAPDLQDMNQLLYNFNTNLSPESIAQLTGFTCGNGFWNSHQSPDAIPGLMMDFINDLTSDQARSGTPGVVLFEANGDIARDRHGNILTTGSLPVTLYEETGLVGNVLRWVANTWFGCTFMRDEIKRELTRYFDLVKLNEQRFGLDPDMEFVHFAHSGDFQPMIEALEHMDNEYRSRIKTLVVYEGPYAGDGIINDPYLETLIRVRGVTSGSSVPLLDHRDFQITDENGNVTALQNQYNIEIIGAGHSDFDYHPEYTDPVQREISRKTNLFMRELTMKAADSFKLKNFLSISRSDGSVKMENGKYVVDILKFESELETP